MKHSRIKLMVIRAFLAIFLISTCAAAIPTTAFAYDEDDCQVEYTVEEGDTLSVIANKYGIRSREIARINNLKRPYDLTKGDVLCIPHTSTNNSTTGKSGASDIPYFSAYVLGSHIVVESSKFPAKTTYYVIVQRGSAKNKVGSLRTGSGGSNRYTFDIPKLVADEKSFSVCLKSTNYTALLSCKSVVQYASKR